MAHAPSIAMGAKTFPMEAFGVDDFEFGRAAQGWVIFSNRDPKDVDKHAGGNCYSKLMLYHATTLQQCRKILTEGVFRVGLYHKSSKSSPAGIWGTTDPGHSVDRAPLSRGWSCRNRNDEDRNILCGWDCPIVLAWSVERRLLYKHKTLNDAASTRVYCLTAPCNTRWDVRGRATEIWIHNELYRRFRDLPSVWKELQQGGVVACRSRQAKPYDLYRAGNASPMTCARICKVEELHEQGWIQVNKTKQ